MTALVITHTLTRDIATWLHRDFPDLDIVEVSSAAEADLHRADIEILITMGPGLTSEMVAGMPRLAWVQALVSGVDHLVRALENRSQVLLTSGSGIHGPQVAEMALAHMLVLSRGLRDHLRAQDRRAWEPATAASARILAGKTVGVVGMGTIGRAIVARCNAFGMDCVAISDSATDADGVVRCYKRAQLRQVAEIVDFLVLAVPLTEDTTGMVDAPVLEAMKPTAYLINVARGGIVVERDLIEALRNRTIAGAGLDAFEQEPLPADHPLWTLDNALLTPHVSGWSDTYAQQIYDVIRPNMQFFLAGEEDRMLNVVAR